MSIFDLAPIPGVTIIGIGHKSRHGKDLVAASMLAYAPIAVRRFAFADQLKAVARVGGMTTKDGVLLQAMGQSMREADADLWERVLYWTIDEIRPRYAVISDVRYRQEADFIKHLGGCLIKVQRSYPDGSPFVNPLRPADHISETQLDNYAGWDYTIFNDSNEHELRKTAVSLFREISGGYTNGAQEHSTRYHGSRYNDEGPKDYQRLPVVLGGSLPNEEGPPGLAGAGRDL